MKKLALGLVGLLMAACGGGGGVKLTDSGVDAPTACNPIAQTGCMANEKCTWVIDFDGSATADPIGHIGCAAQGTVAQGGVCSFARVSTAGIDACVGGSFCVGGQCKAICDQQLASGSAAGACAENFACSRYSGLFEASGVAVAGLCEPGCDPLTQEKLVGTNVAACGSSDPSMPSFTCVPNNGFQSFSCADNLIDPTDPRQADTGKDGEPPFTDRSGVVFTNSCAPGYLPLTATVDGVAKTLCSGLCAPIKVDAETNAAFHAGDPAKLGKLITDAAPVAGHATCFIDTKGHKATNDMPPEQGDDVEDCRFIWTSLISRTTGQVIDSPYNDILGVCYDYTAFPAIDDITKKPPPGNPHQKSCAQLPKTAPTDDHVFGSANDNGCYPLAETTAQANALTRTETARTRLPLRFPYGAGVLTRHVLD